MILAALASLPALPSSNEKAAVINEERGLQMKNDERRHDNNKNITKKG
jgi:hypothetical protein